MTNRASQRRVKRIGRTTKPAAKFIKVKPMGQYGFEVDTVDGTVYASFHHGDICLSVAWSEANARMVADGILEACNRMNTPAENIVQERGSGLVVARTLPPEA
jgi:hypothetical protein